MKFKCIECGYNEFVLKSRTSNDYETDDLTEFPERERDVDWSDEGELEEFWIECSGCAKEYDVEFSLTDVKKQLVKFGVLY
jgi:hypothetical protein